VSGVPRRPRPFRPVPRGLASGGEKSERNPRGHRLTRVPHLRGGRHKDNGPLAGWSAVRGHPRRTRQVAHPDPPAGGRQPSDPRAWVTDLWCSSRASNLPLHELLPTRQRTWGAHPGRSRGLLHAHRQRHERISAPTGRTR